ncbi:MAG: hypothetical protein AAB632_00185 [Patescibacteria group bacterium]
MDTTFLYLVLWAGVLAVIFTILIKKGWTLGGGSRGKTSKGKLDTNFVRSKWQEIEVLMSQQKPSAYKVAILDADKLLDYVLKAKVGSGGTMKDRLVKSRKLYADYQTYKNVGSAHGYRNRVVHDEQHELFPVEVKKMISYFEKALRELRAL